MPYQGGAYGMAVLSRWPLQRSENLRLPDGEEPRSALEVVVELPRTGARLRFVGIHFYRTEEERLAQARSLEEQLAYDSIPTVLAGDFNSEPGTAVMEHLASTWHIVDKGEDSFTFSSFAPEREIDYVLLRPSERLGVLWERVLSEPIASDHRPIFVELVITRPSR
jgi:endonuclease/exonuclease/phosphatase family metal-dependent hydrolase